MRILCYCIFLKVALGGLQIAVHAQDTLSLERCLTIAAQNSPALRSADNEIRSVQLVQSELGTTRLPQLKLSLGASYAPIPPTFGYDAIISNGGEVAGQIVLTQSLYDGGVRSLKSDQLQNDRERFARERRRTERDLRYEVMTAFIEALRAQQEVVLQRSNLDQLTGYLELVRRLYNGGSVGYTDLLTTQVQLSSASVSYQKALEASAVMKYTLAGIIGTPIDTATHFIGSLEDTLGNQHELNLTNSLELEISAFDINRSNLDVELARHERNPVFSFFGDAGYLGSFQNYQLPAADRVRALGYSVGITMELPVMNWGATELRIEERELATDILRSQQELLRRSLLTEYQNTKLRLGNARSRLRSIRASIANAEENFLLTKSKYAGGGALAIEVLAAQQLFTDTKLSELQTLGDIQSLAGKLEQLTTKYQ
ncbi:MAG: TolC family protein [Bacteroidota bacterium]